MKNVIIVGKITDDTKKNCLEVTKKLGFKFIDIEEKFDKILLSSVDKPLILVDEILKVKESEILFKLANKTGVVAFVPLDMFLSNENFEIFNDCFVIGVMSKNLDETDKKIEKLLKMRVNLYENEENFNKFEYIEKFLKKLLIKN